MASGAGGQHLVWPNEARQRNNVQVSMIDAAAATCLLPGAVLENGNRSASCDYSRQLLRKTREPSYLRGWKAGERLDVRLWRYKQILRKDLPDGRERDETAGAGHDPIW